MTSIPEIHNIALQRFPIKYVLTRVGLPNEDVNLDRRLAFIEGYKQAIIDNEPHFAVKGDYCAVCESTEFWNDNNEEEE